MTYDDLKKLIKLCRDTGVMKLEFEGTKIELDHSALLLKPKVKVEDVKEIKDEPMYSDEDILLWSSTGMSEGQ